MRVWSKMSHSLESRAIIVFMRAARNTRWWNRSFVFIVFFFKGAWEITECGDLLRRRQLEVRALGILASRDSRVHLDSRLVDEGV